MGKTGLRRTFAAMVALAGLLFAVEPSLARVRMSFVPGRYHHSYGGRHHSYTRHYHRARSSRHHASSHGGRHGASRSAGDEGPAASAPAGSGFKMEDGVLTYPAPARFQPKNLKHP